LPLVATVPKKNRPRPRAAEPPGRSFFLPVILHAFLPGGPLPGWASPPGAQPVWPSTSPNRPASVWATTSCVTCSRTQGRVFQNEMASHKLPALARVWAQVGSQSEVPTLGKNKKQVICGGGDQERGELPGFPGGGGDSPGGPQGGAAAVQPEPECNRE